jgi:N utilization substance protein A
MSSEISKAIQFLCQDKGLEYEIVLDALEVALAAAYRKDFGNRQQNIFVKFDPETGDMKVWDEKTVVEDVPEDKILWAQEELVKRREIAREEDRELTEEELADLPAYNPKTDLMITEAQKIKETAKLGEVLHIDLEVPGDFGRMAAQTAKQVIIQKIREAERKNVFDDFQDQKGHIVQGTVQRRDRSGAIIIDLGKITGILPATEQVSRDQYRPGVRLRFYVLSVDMGVRGPEIILSRSSEAMVKEVFDQEIPEIASGDVEIKGIARDAGNRSKVAVYTSEDTIDPIGACIGQRGSRITTIIEELGGEKIDVVMWSVKNEDFIKNALSPAKISRVQLDQDTKEAKVFVIEDQFSLAIGRNGQNVRLAAALTGWKIDVVEEGEGKVVSSEDDVSVIQEKLEAKAEEVVSESEQAEVETKTDAPSENSEEGV